MQYIGRILAVESIPRLRAICKAALLAVLEGHGLKEMYTAKSLNQCGHPEKLKGKPGECSPEQIKECHGDINKF